MDRDLTLADKSVVGGGSRFLKKNSTAVTDRLSSAPSSQRLSMEESSWIPQRRSQSAALNRLAQFEQRFKHRKEGSYGQTSSPDPPSPQEAPLSAHSSSDLSMKGVRFLKKKVTSSVPEENKQSHAPQILAKAPPLKVSSKGVSLDSDEEDMKRLLGGSLNSSTESPGLTKKVIQVSKIAFIKGNDQVITYCIFLVFNTDSVIVLQSYKKNTRKTPTTLQDTDTLRQRIPRPPSSELASPIHSLRSVSIVYSPSPSPPNIHSPSRRSPKVRFLRPSQSQSSASVNNEVRSLEELFTDTDDTISEKSAASGGKTT